MGYFGLANQFKLFARYDQRVPRRIRMRYCYQRQRSKQRHQLLIQLGVPPGQAVRHAQSRKSV